MTGRFRSAVPVAILLVVALTPRPMRAAVQYPLALTLDAELKTGVTTVTTKLTIRIDRPMADAYRRQVTDALMHGGYSNFVLALRPVPSVGTIALPSANVEIRYTREDPAGTGSHLILVGDHPLLVHGGDPAKPKAGFDLTLVDLQFDAQGAVTGKLTGAARVRPSPDGTVLLDTYSDEIVQLKGHVGK
jgi:hypothetical protein